MEVSRRSIVRILVNVGQIYVDKMSLNEPNQSNFDAVKYTDTVSQVSNLSRLINRVPRLDLILTSKVLCRNDSQFD